MRYSDADACTDWGADWGTDGCADGGTDGHSERPAFIGANGVTNRRTDHSAN